MNRRVGKGFIVIFSAGVSVFRRFHIKKGSVDLPTYPILVFNAKNKYTSG